METNIQVKERPILFSGAMVRAILNGSKTQTRRVVKPQFEADPTGRWTNVMSSTERKKIGNMEYGKLDPEGFCFTDRGRETILFSGKCPYGQPGDRLWVKETWCGSMADAYEYKADGHSYGGVNPLWKSSLFMPRRASRILLEIVSVRVERVQDISHDDAVAEGVESVGGGRYWIAATDANAGFRPVGSPEKAYRDLWQHINGAESWKANPWCWVVEFKRINP